MEKNKITAIIVDDEPGNIEVLQKLVENYCPQVTVVATAESVDQAAAAMAKQAPGLLFLDIEMPGKNAFDLLEMIRPVKPEIIFVTAFQQYAIKAMRYSAIDYLLKPINIEELKMAVARAVERMQEKNMQARLNNYLAMLQKKEVKLAIQTAQGYEFHSYEEIVCCSAEGSYTILYFVNGKKLLSSSPLKHFGDLLPENTFCRVHHSHLINLDHVIRYNRGRSGVVEMSNGMEVEVSQRKKELLLNRFTR